MNITLPIVIKPSRLSRGVGAVAMAAAAIFIALRVPAADFGAFFKWQVWVVYFIIAALGIVSLNFARECIFGAPPEVIIDEDGVGGCFIGGGFVGVERVAWDDIIWGEIAPYYFHGAIRLRRELYLEVNNDKGKYIPARKRASKNAAFALDVTFTGLNKKQVEEINAVINSRAKGKPSKVNESAKPQEFGKLPIATDE